MSSITLSYLIATKNKLPYLKRGLEKVIIQKKQDEEILIADGGSTDGTREYLESLKAQGKIDYFISEPDFGLAHALNKLIIIANGTLLKYLSDDDVFDFSIINECKRFMLEHPEIDLINTEGGSLNDPSRTQREHDPLQIVRTLDYSEKYKKWQNDHIPFYFCDLGVLFRRSSIPVVGGWNPSFPGPDIEFSLRVSAGKVNIAWFTGYSYVNISNPQSVSMVFMKKTKKLTDKLNKFYFDKNPELFIINKLRILKNKIISNFKLGKRKSHTEFDIQWSILAEISEKWIEIKNNQKKSEFIWKKDKN
ncbi:MAG: glycosyltransferase [Patescibacteria group bacterium]